MTTQEEHDRDIEYMKRKLREAEYWSTEGYGRGSMSADYSKIDSMTPGEIRDAYRLLTNAYGGSGRD